MQKSGNKPRFFSLNKTIPPATDGEVSTTNATRSRTRFWTILVFVLSIIAVVLFFYLDRHNTLSMVLRSWGGLGVVFAILFKALITVTPVPTEGILLIFMKVYGVWWGVLYSWIGGVLSSFLIFIAARHVGRPLLQSVITQDRFTRVDTWVKKRGMIGLLFIRLLPIPGFISSYILGTIPSVHLWPYVWSEAISVVPYYLGTALIYLGVSAHYTIWLSIGVLALLIFWGASFIFRKKFTS